MHLDGAQGDNFPVHHEPDVFPLRRLLQPVAQAAPAFGDGESLHTHIMAYKSVDAANADSRARGGTRDTAAVSL